MEIIAEIGVNHLGKPELLDGYIKNLKNIGVDGVSIQLLDKKKVSTKLKKFCLKKIDIKKFCLKAKKEFKYVGVGIHTWDNYLFLKKLKLDFIKILGSSLGNLKYYQKIKKTNVEKIFLSTLGKSTKEILSFLEKIDKKRVSLIFTFLETNNYINEIKKIDIYKKKFNLNIAYGNHYNKIYQIPKVAKHNPSEIFFYVKMNKNINYPDNNHAVPLNQVKDLIKKIKKNG